MKLAIPNKYIVLGVLISVLTGLLVFKYFSPVDYLRSPSPTFESNPRPTLQIKSIDTMKYSRDLAREKAEDLAFGEVISTQMQLIAQTGATHVAIGTPYDAEFIPFMKKWVKAARANNLQVWFRGNFAGWEGWFGYPKITRAQASQQLEEFILQNPDLFANGDLFTPCAECENGGPGDPRQTGDVVGFREHLIQLYTVSQESFAKINKQVEANYFSMNGDVARLIMDKETTRKLDGVVVVDHYVKTPHQLVADIRALAKSSGGKIVLGEFGAPIPDIHGTMNETEQAAWLQQATTEFSKIIELIGVNYWVCCGGSTQLWTEQFKPRKAVDILRNYYEK